MIHRSVSLQPTLSLLCYSLSYVESISVIGTKKVGTREQIIKKRGENVLTKGREEKKSLQVFELRERK